MSFDSRVVLDTSTLIGALLKPHSPPAQALICAREFFAVIVSSETLGELKRVLDRDRLDRYRSPEERATFFREYSLMAIEVDVTESVTACRDPNDDKFLPLAVSGGAAIIVSSDQDLLTMGQYRGVPILTARAFIELCDTQV